MSNFDSKEFGERIKSYRIRKGLSQENLANALNKSTAIISRYESGEVLPDVKDISMVLGAYFGTNAKCEPSLRKCYFSKNDIEFTDEMFDNLKLDENELEILEKQNALYLDIFKE